jgi:hypothetical protein
LVQVQVKSGTVGDAAGAVLAMYGTSAGIKPDASRAWRRGHDDLLGSPAMNAWFGFAVI